MIASSIQHAHPDRDGDGWGWTFAGCGRFGGIVAGAAPVRCGRDNRSSGLGSAAATQGLRPELHETGGTRAGVVGYGV